MERMELCMDVGESESDYKTYRAVLKLFDGDFGHVLEHGVALTIWILSQLNQERKVLCHDMQTGKCLFLELDKLFSLSRVRAESFRIYDYELRPAPDATIDVDENLITLDLNFSERLRDDFYKILRCLIIRKEARVVDVIVLFVHQHAIITAEKKRLISVRAMQNNKVKLAAAIPVWT